MCSTSTTPCSCGCGPTTNLANLGMVAKSKRAIKSGIQYDRYFDLSQLQGVETTIAHGDQKDTLSIMEKWVKKHAHQTKRIAQALKGSTLLNTLSNVWHFLYEHVQYKLDVHGREQLRTPLRVWADRATGVDCDCYSIFISSILHNLGIPHAFRMTKYSGDWQHVYVVVPKDGKKASLQHRSTYYVVDPVKDSFNSEQPFTAKYDRFMNIEITGLSGLGACATENQIVVHPTSYDLAYTPVRELEREGKVSTEQYLLGRSIPYQVVAEEGGKLALAVQVQDQLVKVPTILTQEEAETINTLANTPAEEIAITTTEDAPAQAGIDTGWLIAFGVLAGGLWLFHAAKPKAGGLMGTPKQKRAYKRKPVKITL